MEKNLTELEIGESGVIVNVLGEGRLRHRLFDMGVTPSANVTMVKKSPLGDPIEINIRGYSLTLRKTEALNIILKVSDKEAK